MHSQSNDFLDSIHVFRPFLVPRALHHVTPLKKFIFEICLREIIFVVQNHWFRNENQKTGGLFDRGNKKQDQIVPLQHFQNPFQEDTIFDQVIFESRETTSSMLNFPFYPN